MGITVFLRNGLDGLRLGAKQKSELGNRALPFFFPFFFPLSSRTRVPIASVGSG